MAKNKSYTGSRQSVGVPTLSKNNYLQLMRKIRKEMERRNAESQNGREEVSTNQLADCGDP